MNNQEEFERFLARGRKAEDATARWILRKLGYIIAPVNKIEEGNGKGPRLYLPNGRTLVSPDLFCIKPTSSNFIPLDLPPVFKDIPFFWIDVKLKSKASFYRMNARWQTGIDKRCLSNYREVRKMTGMEVWIFHLILPTPDLASQLQRVPPQCLPAPTGLYGHPASLPYSDDFQGMVYWGISELTKFAELSDLPIAALTEEAA